MTSTIVHPGGSNAVLVAGGQPMRLALVVCPVIAGAHVALSLVRQTPGFDFAPVTPATPMLIHASSYPLLVSMPWFAFAEEATDLIVYQVIREQT